VTHARRAFGLAARFVFRDARLGEAVVDDSMRVGGSMGGARLRGVMPRNTVPRMRTLRGPGLSVVAMAAISVLVAEAAPPAPAPALAAPVVLAADAKQPSAAVDATGTVYVAYLRSGNVVVSASKDRGKTFAEPVVAIDAKGKARGGAQRGPRIGADAKGRLVVTSPITFDEAESAKQYPKPELYLTTSADGGVTWSAPVRVNEIEKKAPEGLHTMRVAPDGTAHIAWLDLRERASGQDLWYAKVTDGKVGLNVRVAQDVCPCCAPGLALDAAGNPLLAWREGGEKDSRELFSMHSTDGGATFDKPARINRVDTKEDG
jgi:hypothetical protein